MRTVSNQSINLKSKWYKIPIYSGKLLVVITDSFVSSAVMFNIWLRPDADNTLGIALVKKKEGAGEYAIFIKTTHEKDFAVIAHEALHTTNSILNSRGVKPSFSNDEPQAYLLSWVVEQVIKTIGEKEKTYKL